MFQLTVMSQWNHMVRSQDDFTVKKCEVTFWGHGKVNIVSSHFFWTHGVMFQLTVMSQWNHKLTSQDDFTTKKCEVTFWDHSKTHIVRSSNFFGELDMSQTWDQIVDWVGPPNTTLVTIRVRRTPYLHNRVSAYNVQCPERPPTQPKGPVYTAVHPDTIDVCLP